ncbi:MAG: LytR/AlgR family response regulator transcription factor [Bacillota bacterium]
MITVLIAEDDPVLRQVLKGFISAVPGIDVIAEAGDGIEALELFEKYHPKCVILDINMPRRNGMEVAKEIFDIDPWVYIVFCTGLSGHREEADEIYAFDYMTKPFKPDRIKKTMNRIVALEQNISDSRSFQENISLTRTNKNIVQGSKLLKIGEKFVMLNLDDIFFFTKENRKTLTHYTGGDIYIDESLTSLEEQLRDSKFFRSHKGFLINIQKVSELVPCGKSTYYVIMKDAQKRAFITWDKIKELEKLCNQ